jgi:MFS superfamily sulfate permease-like transporter
MGKKRSRRAAKKKLKQQVVNKATARGKINKFHQPIQQKCFSLQLVEQFFFVNLPPSNDKESIKNAKYTRETQRIIKCRLMLLKRRAKNIIQPDEKKLLLKNMFQATEKRGGR